MSKLDYCFSNDYMVLRPDRASPVELLHLLLSPKVGRNRAVDCFASTDVRSFHRRLAIFLNLLLQILLLSLAAPLAALGAAVELLLNLVDNVLHGQCILFVWYDDSAKNTTPCLTACLSLCRGCMLCAGRMEYPDKSSPTYRSMTGLIDRRVDLDRSIKPTDSRFDAALCVMASKLAYENEPFIRNVVTRHWQNNSDFGGPQTAAMIWCRWSSCVSTTAGTFQNAYTAQAFVFCDKPVIDAEVIVVAFRGTRPLDAARWCADVDPSWYKIPRLGCAHAAYTHALGAQRNIGWPKWVDHIKGKPQKVTTSLLLLLGINLGVSNDSHTDTTASSTDDRRNTPAPDDGAVTVSMCTARMQVYAYYTIRDALKEVLEANKKARLLVTGHGSGGALAVLFPAILAYHKEKTVLDRLAGVYTFGQPRVGDAMLAMFVERNLDRPKKRHFRITYGHDSLPRLPIERSAFHFLHFGLGLHFDKSYELKVRWEIPGEEETSSSLLVDLVASRVNSAWELGRGVYLGYRRGGFFREGWLLLLLRAAAVALPGLPFHRVQDYVNAVVLGGHIPEDN
ncbi:hypothetical protein HU200_057853 [Digitaria exilis]|uniref:Fungal lipase-type domain-containing protein n=1 Tax=Digitaria exilis TaxID=1010633 RepID=A0A835ANX6_9POAL|nr:hypothetical protein HU200_057853 [Digitaria exilis]